MFTNENLKAKKTDPNGFYVQLKSDTQAAPEPILWCEMQSINYSNQMMLKYVPLRSHPFQR